MQPGFVPNAGQTQQPAATGLTADDIKALIAQAMPQAPQAPAPAATPPAAAVPAPAEFSFAEDSNSDPVLSSLTKIMVNTAPTLDLDRAIGKAISYGDPKLIDLAYIKEQGGANAEQLAVLAKSMVERANTKANEAQASVFSVAGGQPAWQAASAAFNQNAPQHLKVVVAKLLDSGDSNAIKAAAQTVVDFAGNKGLVPAPGQFLGAGANAANAAQALDKAGFQQELRKLDPNSRTFQQDRDALFARRQLGKNMGR
jgi:hypothetical protein